MVCPFPKDPSSYTAWLLPFLEVVEKLRGALPVACKNRKYL
jgi:hypothetical protein